MNDESRAMLDHVAEVREDIDRQSQRFELARERAGARSVRDESGAVHVTVDADGRIGEVAVEADWRSRLTDEALPGAVLNAYQVAVTELTATWAEAVADPSSEAQRARPVAATAGDQNDATTELLSRVEAAGAETDDRVVLERMLELLTDLDRAMDRAFDDIDRRATTEHAGRSSSGHVTARVSGAGELVGVEYDERWLPTAHSFNVGRETTEAVAAAVRRFALVTEQDRAEDPLTELTELAQDPAAFAARLGFAG